jgi:hypothetical protein
MVFENSVRYGEVGPLLVIQPDFTLNTTIFFSYKT